MIEDLTEEELKVWNWQMGYSGDFQKSLFTTISKANMYNLTKLLGCFPTEVKGYLNFSNVVGWWERIEKKVTASDLSEV